MSTVTQPKSVVPIGYLMMGGKRLDVSISPEFNRFFDTVVRRLGGTSGDSVDAVQVTANEALFRANSAGSLFQPPKVLPGEGMQVSSSFGANTVTIDPEYVRALLPRPTQAIAIDDAQAIIANRSFGR